MNISYKAQLQLIILGIFDNGWPLPFFVEESFKAGVKISDYLPDMIQQGVKLLDLIFAENLGEFYGINIELLNLTQDQKNAILKLNTMKFKLWGKITGLMDLNKDENASESKISEAIITFRQDKENIEKQISEIEETVLKMNLSPRVQLSLTNLGLINYYIGMPLLPVIMLFPPE